MAKLRKDESLQAYVRTSEAFAFILLSVHVFFFCSFNATARMSTAAVWCNNVKKMLSTLFYGWRLQPAANWITKLNGLPLAFGRFKWLPARPLSVSSCRECVWCKRTTKMIEEWKTVFFSSWKCVVMPAKTIDAIFHPRTFHFFPGIGIGSISNVCEKLIDFGYDSRRFQIKSNNFTIFHLAVVGVAWNTCVKYLLKYWIP